MLWISKLSTHPIYSVSKSYRRYHMKLIVSRGSPICFSMCSYDQLVRRAHEMESKFGQFVLTPAQQFISTDCWVVFCAI